MIWFPQVTSGQGFGPYTVSGPAWQGDLWVGSIEQAQENGRQHEVFIDCRGDPHIGRKGRHPGYKVRRAFFPFLSPPAKQHWPFKQRRTTRSRTLSC